MIQFLAKSTFQAVRLGCRRGCPCDLSPRITTLAIAACAAFIAQTLVATPIQAQSSERPNIILILADDQSFETTGAGGSREVKTPALDALAARGTTFTHCFNMGSWSGAVCVASRTMLNTGRYVWRANEVYNSSEAERKAGRWWSEYMKGAGYKTYITGKWHCKAKPEEAFDVAQHVRGGMPKQTPTGYSRPPADGDDPWSPSDPKFGGFWEGGKHWSEVVADDALQFIDDAKSQQQPFFMYVAFNAPHDPRQSPQSYVDRYPADRIAVPRNFLPEYPFKDEIGCGKSLRDERLGIFPRTEHCVQVHRQEYYAIISHMDDQIARILEHLRASGQDQNTWIFFTADHGLACGHHGLMGKQNLYDHSVRVPFTVVGPGVKAGQKIDHPIYLQDVMPTSLELAGVDKPEHVEFQSLLGLMDPQHSDQASAAAHRQRQQAGIYGAYLNLQRSVRTQTHKLIVYPKAKRLRLYDLKNDPDEMNDLADDPQSAPVIDELFAKLQKLQHELDDDVDLSGLWPAQAAQ